MGSCFWADARSRAAYQYFGDVVTFDATYLTNIYKMPFVPFSGVNHHHQTIMFGCALLVNKTGESYTWLLRTWQEAMLGRAPSTIITDDDKVMAKAIVEVLPNTTHRLCLWHILQKFPEHLAHVYNKFLDFQKDFCHCIHETITTDEFEQEWALIMVKYDLGENTWLQNLYSRRDKWVPAYLHSTFCAGMSTTQRSESMNKFFKDYVRSSTMVSDFVHQYEKAIDARYFKEKEKDVRTKSTRAIMKTPFKIEEEAAIVYTRKSFTIFQDELFNSLRYQARKLYVSGEAKTYGVTAHGKETPIYHVTLEGDEGHATYTCHKWEFMRILCRHILCVFGKKAKLNILPQHYVLDRWTINAKSRPIPDIPCSDDQVRQVQDEATMRKSKSMIQLYDIVELASQSAKKHNHFTLALEKVYKELLAMEDHVECSQTMPTNECIPSRSQVISNFSQTVQDPPRVPTKGRPKSLRAKNPKETQTTKKRRCSICKNEGHAKNNCPSVRLRCRVWESATHFLNIFIMGEIDTKPIEPIQIALSLFGEKSDQRKSWCTSSDEEDDEAALEQTLLVIQEVAIYKIWSGCLRIVSCKARCESTVESILNSSRYSVLKIEDGRGKSLPGSRFLPPLRISIE
ncbi:protein FAR1-RELATED SEQUENCE 5-like [Juglans regia]|uniref:Protein FAR1-RELATED SEQUENCE n=1 Tax=Juglans regia TaxID=51240 RepID=A0A6P9EB96_JUGRE|nr:protein FAR1-RELATED SEQUENCE 5-like [Juglans regia]